MHIGPSIGRGSWNLTHRRASRLGAWATFRRLLAHGSISRRALRPGGASVGDHSGSMHNAGTGAGEDGRRAMIHLGPKTGLGARGLDVTLLIGGIGHVAVAGDGELGRVRADLHATIAAVEAYATRPSAADRAIVNIGDVDVGDIVD